MTLHTALEKILTEWNEERSKPFKNNQLANYIRSEFPRIVKNSVTIQPIVFFHRNF